MLLLLCNRYSPVVPSEPVDGASEPIISLFYLVLALLTIVIKFTLLWANVSEQNSQAYGLAPECDR